MDDCYVFPRPNSEPNEPIKDSLKDSTFIPDLQAFVTLNCKYRNDDDFWVEMFAQFGTRTSGFELTLNKYTNVKESLEFVRGLHRVTGNMLEFAKLHSLKGSESQDD